MRRGEGEVDLVGHGNGLRLPGIDNGNSKMERSGEGRGNARDLSRQYLGRAELGETVRELPAAMVHQGSIHLMIDKAVHFQNPVPQNLPVALNTILKFLHPCLLEFVWSRQ